MVLVSGAYFLKRKFSAESELPPVRNLSEDLSPPQIKAKESPVKLKDLTDNYQKIPQSRFDQAGSNISSFLDRRVLTNPDSPTPVKFKEFEDFLYGKKSPENSYIVRKSTWDRMDLDRSLYTETKVDLDGNSEYLLISHRPDTHLTFFKKSELDGAGIKKLDGSNNIVGLKNYRAVKDLGGGVVVKVDDLTPKFPEISYNTGGFFPASTLKSDRYFSAKVSVSKKFKLPDGQPEEVSGSFSMDGKFYDYHGKFVGGGTYGRVYVVDFTDGSDTFTLWQSKNSRLIRTTDNQISEHLTRN